MADNVHADNICADDIGNKDFRNYSISLSYLIPLYPGKGGLKIPLEE